MASSADYGRSKFNLAAQGHRQPGSTFKIMGLMAALDQGVSPSTQYTSRPLNFNDPKYGPIKVKTYSNSYKGRISLAERDAVLGQLGLPAARARPRARTRSRRPRGRWGSGASSTRYPSEVLGGLEDGVSPLEMANAYATIASGGWRNRPKAITRVTFPDGHVSNWGKPARHKAFSDGVTYEATKILEQNMTRPAPAPARRSAAPRPARPARPTTTPTRGSSATRRTSRPRSGSATPGQRVPMEPPTTPISVAGGTYPATIWGKYMKVAKKGCGDFSKPKQAFQTKPFKGKYQQIQPEPKEGTPGDETDKKKDTDKKPDGNGNGDGGGQRRRRTSGRRAARAAAGTRGPAATGPAGARTADAGQPAQPAPQGGAPVDPEQYQAPG